MVGYGWLAALFGVWFGVDIVNWCLGVVGLLRLCMILVVFCLIVLGCVAYFVGVLLYVLCIAGYCCLFCCLVVCNTV